MSYFALLIIHIFSASVFNTDIVNVKDQDKINNGIELIINNIRNKTGILRIGLYDTNKGYPDHPEVSFSIEKDTIISGQLRFLIPVKQSGLFAISILDDENENGKMDYRFGIMPKEGFGFSNNPRIKSMKEPPFEETCFTYNGGKKVVTVKMVYI
jgi:uncharacterized protein (DUF2141 family)